VVVGDVFPIQIIESKKLSGSDNLWLKNLSNDLNAADLTRLIGEHLGEIKESNLNAYIYAVFHANKAMLKEAAAMSLQPQSLEPLEDVIDELMAEGYFKKLADKYKDEGRDEGRDKGRDEAKFETAKEMFKEGDSVEKIARVTKLPFDRLSEMLRTQ
jgi:predicted transposase/invertase (TIGR01784 family)